MMKRPGQRGGRAGALWQRPGASADAVAWEKLVAGDSPYLFYSELGSYRWYVDPLAKKRGVPCKRIARLAAGIEKLSEYRTVQSSLKNTVAIR